MARSNPKKTPVFRTVPRKPARFMFRAFWAQRRARAAVVAICVLCFIGLFADFLANEKPILARRGNHWISPVIHEYGVKLGWARWHEPFLNPNWQEIPLDWALPAAIPYSPFNTDHASVHQKPGARLAGKSWRYTHWLGTDTNGRDLAAGMVHGTRSALVVGIVAILLAASIGLVLGSVSGFWGNRSVKVYLFVLLAGAVSLFFGWYYGIFVRLVRFEQVGTTGWAIFGSVFLLPPLVVARMLHLGDRHASATRRSRIVTLFFSVLYKKVYLPLDLMVNGLIQLVVTIPTLLVILTVMAWVKNGSMLLLATFIGFLSWPIVARLTRAELMRVRELDYMVAGRAMGFSQLRLLWRHALPNAVAPAIVYLSFGVAASVLTEAAFSFFNIGLAAEQVTWGRLIYIGSQAPDYWWLCLFPGFGLFVTISSFLLLGEAINTAMNPKEAMPR